jgi:AraC family transcriptional regulator
MEDARPAEMKSRSTPGQILYESQAAFYSANRPTTIIGDVPLFEGAVMHHVEQGAGDWSDAPTRDLVIIVIESGRGESMVDLGAGRTRGRFLGGQALVMAPSAGSSILRSARHSLWGLGLRYSWLRGFAGEGLELPESGDFGRLHAGPSEDQLLVALHRSLHQSPNGARDRLFLERVILLLAARLEQLSRPERPKASRPTGLSDWQLRRATRALEATMREGISLNELARLTGLSTFHFARAFKKATGVAPRHYQIQPRIERAKELLVGTVAPVGDIGAQVGYDDVGYFTKVFARNVGATPVRYRMERRG